MNTTGFPYVYMIYTAFDDVIDGVMSRDHCVVLHPCPLSKFSEVWLSDNILVLRYEFFYENHRVPSGTRTDGRTDTKVLFRKTGKKLYLKNTTS